MRITDRQLEIIAASFLWFNQALIDIFLIHN
jgi:hypothetical protein